MAHFFISYSHSDKQRVTNLVQEIKERYFPVWIDENISVGEKWSAELSKAIKSCTGFILMMSPASAGSPYVEAEVQLALELKKEIFPILIEPIDKEDFWLLKPIQYEDLRRGKKMSDSFFSKLATLLHASPSSPLSEAEADKAVMKVSQNVQLWEQQRTEIADYLKECASQDNLPVSYSVVANKFGFNLENPAERNRLSNLLGSISKIEHSAGRPLLSAMVVRSSQDAPYPGKGFYQLARYLKPQDYSDISDNVVIYAAELKAIREFYQE